MKIIRTDKFPKGKRYLFLFITKFLFSQKGETRIYNIEGHFLWKFLQIIQYLNQNSTLS